MNLPNEILANCNYLLDGKAKSIESMPVQYPAYTIKIDGVYSVAIPCKEGIEFSERFNRCKVHSCWLTIDGMARNWLLLTCLDAYLAAEFSTIAAYFVDPGANGEVRELLYSDPFAWWRTWSVLIGNKTSKKTVYDVIGELLVLNIEFSKDKSFEWTAINHGSNDLESTNKSVEVKSTIKRYESFVTISGQFQLKTDNMLLYFCRLEKSPMGFSIDDVIEMLVSSGYSRHSLENYMEAQELERGSSNRREKYKILEIRKYLVDSSFPRITPDSFKKNQLPPNIYHIKYDVDLNGIPYTDVEFYK